MMVVPWRNASAAERRIYKMKKILVRIFIAIISKLPQCPHSHVVLESEYDKAVAATCYQI